MQYIKMQYSRMRRLHVFSLTSLSFAALAYLSGCGDDSPPATNTAPEFEQETYSFTLAENAATGDEIGSVSATDADENATLTYSITTTQTDFAINDGTGAVTVAEAALDFESTTSYTLAVQVSDGTDTDEADITVTITDVNESSPEFAFADNATSYSFSLAADAAVGAEVGKISATDADGTAQLTYTLSDEEAANFAITDGTNVDSGTEVTVTVAADADLPALASPVELTITVSDGENTVNATAEIVITPIETQNVAPVFDQTTYTFTIASDAAAETPVGTVSATDSNDGDLLTYSLSGEGADNFAISSTPVASGEEVTVTVAADADLPALASPVELTITVSDGTDQVTANVEITIIAGNVAPIFANTPYSFSLAEDAADDAVVGTVSATDSNAGDLLAYSLSGEGADNFAISSTPVASGEEVSVTVAANADLPSLTSPVTLIVTVTDDETPALTATANVEITIIAGNVAPIFANTPYSFSLSEDASDGAVVGTVSATDSNDGDLLAYSLSGEGADNFAIADGTNAASGEEVSVTVATNADLPALVSPVALTVEVSDGTDQVTANVEITIIEGNVAPVFDQTAYTFAVNEDAESGDVVDAVSATDSNAGNLLAYTLSGEGADHFAISNTPVASGTDVQITVSSTASLDHETVDSYTLEVKASDDASPALTAVAEITINVGDVNEHDPVFAQASYIFSVEENAPASTVVDVVAATDADGTATIAYRMVTTPTDFDIDANTGEIKVGTSATLDFETTTTSYMLQVEASDGTKTAMADVTINVDDVNDNAPVFSGAPYTFGVEENSPVDTEVGMVSATDADANTTLEYSIVPPQTDFDIDANTGKMTVASASLDFETTASYSLEVQASDGATPALTATTTVTINVNDLNDEAPVFDQTAYTFEIEGANALSGDEVGTVAATDADAGATLEYSITNTQTEFDIDTNTGIITVSDAAVFDRSTTPSYTLTVQVDDNDDTNTAMVEVTINIVEADYDADGDGLIEINNLEQLNAMRWDLDGDGMPDAANQADYEAAFPDAAAFATTPTGYELMRNLDFDAAESYGSGTLNTAWSTNTGVGWDPIGRSPFDGGTAFTATFDGNGNTLSNLYISNGTATYSVGLFGHAESIGFRNVGLLDVDITGNDSVGGLIGVNNNTNRTLTITNCYVTGVVTGDENVGGLVGHNFNGGTGTITMRACYSECTVTGTGDVGGLVGYNENTSTTDVVTLAACYATGNVTGETQVGGLFGHNFTNTNLVSPGSSTSATLLTACYATGDVTSTGDGLPDATSDDAGGLLGEQDLTGRNRMIAKVTACYATGVVTISLGLVDLIGDNFGTTEVSYIDVSRNGDINPVSGFGKTTVQLQEPTGYTGIYMEWNVDIDDADGDGDVTTGSDDPWDFGTSSQYPVLKVDFNGDGSTADDVTRQRQ